MAAIRSADDAYAAGYEDGACDPPLTREQAIRIALILAGTRKQQAEAA